MRRQHITERLEVAMVVMSAQAASAPLQESHGNKRHGTTMRGTLMYDIVRSLLRYQKSCVHWQLEPKCIKEYLGGLRT